MAYVLTAIMTGGVSALLSAVLGGTLGEILWSYVAYGYLGMSVLALAFVTNSFLNRTSASQNDFDADDLVRIPFKSGKS